MFQRMLVLDYPCNTFLTFYLLPHSRLVSICKQSSFSAVRPKRNPLPKRPIYVLLMLGGIN